jgi:predicted exporter
MVETATGMRSDMKQSVACTVLMIAALFWWAHRQFRPLAWMLLMLGVALVATLGLGGLVFGTLNVVSAGFAAILLGLGVDYALVLYQELLDSPAGITAQEVRRHAQGGIWWSAGTTALAFALLNFAGLPGFGQLGTLVAIGIILAAAVMLHGFLPMVVRRIKPVSRPPVMRAFWNNRVGWGATALATVVCAAVLVFAWPDIDRTSDLFSSKSSEAARVARAMEAKMNHGAQTSWALTRGKDTLETRRRLEKLDTELRSKNIPADLPLALWPDVERQRANLPALKTLAARLADLEAAVEKAGFTSDAMTLARKIIQHWTRMNAGRDAIWPANSSIRWLIDRVAARADNEWVALGMIRGSSAPNVATEGAIVTSWTRLAGDLLAKVETRMMALTIGIVLVLIVCLRLALRSWIEVALSFATLGFGFALMTTAMALLGWKWNLLNLTVIPLLLGASVDYTIHVQRALRRYRGDATAMRRTIGRALFLLTAAAVAGFGSLGFASNAGWASFELLCALGMICIFVTALYLLPAWHYSLVKYGDD